MNQSSAPIRVSPAQVLKNTCLHVKTSSPGFTETEYRITDENGRVVRKGSVCERISEFTLSMVGIKTGVYRFIMGTAQEKFVVVL
jgi:hypothetical protein